MKSWFRRSRNGSGDADSRSEPCDPASQVERLVDGGQFTEAIQALSEMNRRARDPAVEKRILDLRFDAFDHIARRAAPPSWPDSVVDLFPGELVPTVDRAQLSVETLRSGIVNHGSLHVRGLIDQDQVGRLRDSIDRSVDAYDAAENGAVTPDLEGWFVPCERCPEADRAWKRRAGAVLAIDSPPALFDLVEVLDEVGISRLAHEHSGEAPTLLGLKTTLRKVPRAKWGPGDWHQDGSFMGTDIRSLNVWIALTHCGDDAPGLDVVGRRLDHLAETGTNGALAKWSVGAAVAEHESRGTVVRPIFEPGDALLFDHLMLHRTANHPDMVNERYAIETWLFSPSTYDIMTATDDQPNPPQDQRPFQL